MKIYFSSLGYEINYDVEFSLVSEYTISDKIALKIEGREKEDFLNKNSEKGKIELLYKFRKDSHEIFSVTGNITTFERKQEYSIEFQIYELKNF